MILEQLALARDHTTWHALMAPALAALHCRVMPSTSDEAPGLLAYGAPHLGAHHSPDIFHGQHELVQAVSGPLATKQRAAIQAATAAQQRLDQAQGPLQGAGDEPQPQGPAHDPTQAAR